MARYLLPCPDCHETFPVATRHAGQTIECANCQSAVEIPKLGELRQLPEESEQRTSQSGPRQVRQSRSRLKSWLFSGGLMIAVLSAVAGIALLNYANGLYSPISEYTDLIEKTSNEEIDTMAAAQMWDWWSRATKIELGEWQENPGVGSNIQSEILTRIAYLLFGLSAVGLLSLLCSFGVGKQK